MCNAIVGHSIILKKFPYHRISESGGTYNKNSETESQMKSEA